MLILAVCTEGENTEPNYLTAVKKVFSGTDAKDTSVDYEIVPIPLYGNGGHRKVFEIAERKIEECRRDERNLLSIVGLSDEIEKWLIIDYDKMEEHLPEKEFRELADTFGYKVVVNRPNFEYYVLRHFLGRAKSIKVLPKDLVCAINAEVEKYNKKIENSVLKLPIYSKKKYVSMDFFDKLLSQHPEIISRFIADGLDDDRTHYSGMPKLLTRLEILIK